MSHRVALLSYSLKNAAVEMKVGIIVAIPSGHLSAQSEQ